MQRLHVDTITSIGAVEDGDDPEASIVLWKAKPLTKAEARRKLKALRIEMQRKRPAMSRKDVEAEILRLHPEIATALNKSAPTAGGKARPAGPSLSPVERGRAVVEYVTKTLDRQDEALTKITDDYRKIGETMAPRKAEMAPAGTVRAKVDTLALEKVEKGASPNLTQARADVWRERPDLVEASRKEPGRVPGVYGGRAPAADTVAERIGQVVKERADEMAGVTQWWNLSDAERRVIVWKSPQGKKLRDAYTASMKAGDAKFTKSNDHPDAMRILKAWEADPAEGLR